MAGRESFSIGVLFLFHFVWSMLFYRFIQSNVVEVMGRFPPREFDGERVNLFLNESLLLLQKTDIAKSFIWILIAYIATRLLLTPLLHAGIYNSLFDTLGPRGTVFIRGTRRLGGSFAWLYLLRLALTAIPLYWAVPSAARTFAASDSYLSLALGLAPWIVGFAVYGALLKLFFMYVLFALTSEQRLLGSLFFSIRHLLPICGLALSVYAVTASLSLLVYSASLFWAGFFAVVVYLVYPLLQIWLKLWGIAVQYRFWTSPRI